MAQRIASARPAFSVALPQRAALMLAAGLLALLLIGLAWLAFQRSASESLAAENAQARVSSAAALTASLTRVAQLGDGEAQLILTPQRFFQATGRPSEGLGFGADRTVVFVLNENVHYTELPHHPGVILRVDGTTTAAPTELRVLTDAVHHRTSVLVFGELPATLLDGDHELEMLVPANTRDLRVAVSWRTPIAYPDRPSGEGGLSLGFLLSLGAGLLASMWPCLLQLSAYFLPSVAGLSLAEADRGVRRAPVLRTAVLFVSGIVVVYTLAGAAAGLAAQSLAASTLFEDARRPLTIAAGLLVLAMAARIAVRARAPLVCKMPVIGLAGRFGNGPIGTMALGLAFATGCMTCFGAAVVLGMFTYVVSTASALTGAVLLFLFSLGLAVPLVLAAVAMARILPLLGHLERNARYLSLASAAIMALYGALLLSGNTHLLSDLAARAGAL